MDRTKIVWTKSSLNRKCCRIAGKLKLCLNLKNICVKPQRSIFSFSQKSIYLWKILYITSLLESLTWRWWIGSERTRRWQKCRQQILLGTLLGRSSQSTTQYWFGFQWQIESTLLAWLKEGNWFLTTTINEFSTVLVDCSFLKLLYRGLEGLVQYVETVPSGVISYHPYSETRDIFWT